MSNQVLKEFGRTIRHLRIQKNITQEELAACSGFHRTYIGQVERGERNPSLVNITVFAETFGITLSELFKLCEQLKKLK
jgi:transcriptional regulator with XRE-family HTH domain